MKLDEFIKNVLTDIDNGLKSATESTDRGYYVEINNQSGVRFDIAVTTVSAKGTQAEGKAKVGFIEVLGAGVGAKLEEQSENSEVSRIQFTVAVPSETQTEYKKNLEDYRS